MLYPAIGTLQGARISLFSVIKKGTLKTPSLGGVLGEPRYIQNVIKQNKD
jgi:hypothetical protein